MEENENIRYFYDFLSSQKNKIDLGSYEQFSEAMTNDPETRKWVFDKSKSLGMQVGDDYNLYEQSIVPKRVDVSDVEAQQQPQVPQMGAGDVAIEGDGRFKPSWGFERSQKMQDKMPEPKPAVKTVNEKTEYDFSPENVQGMREFAEGAYVKAFDEVNALMPEIERSIRERALFDTEQNNRNKDASREAIEYHANKEADRRIKQFREKMEKEGTAGFSGESLASYLAFDDEELRDKIASAYNDKDAVDKYMQAYYQSPEGKAERTREADNAKVMVDELKGKRSQGFWNTVGGMFGDMAISASMAEGGMSYQDQQQLSKIQDGIRRTNSVNMAINQSLHEAENTLNVAIKNIEEGKGNAFVQLGRGVRYANLDNVIPMSDLYGQMGVLQLYEKLDEDGKPKEPLTQDEQTLYESLALNKYVSDRFGGYQTMLNRIGSGLPEQAMFTLSFLLSSEFAGAQTIGRGATNVLRRGIGNVVNKEIKSGIGRFMLDKALPTAFGMGAETLYRTGLQVPAIMSGAIERHVGTIKVNPETGEVGGFENGVDWDEALWKSTLNVANETGTELVGDRIIEPGLGWFGRNTIAGKRIADFRKYIGEIGDGTVDDILKMGDDISHKAGWSKWYIEVGEEEVGAFNNAAFIHDQTWEEAFSRKALMETTLNCMIFGVAMGTSTTTAQAMRNMPSTVTTRNEKRKASRIIDKMDGISTDEIDEHINNDSSNELADWLVDKSEQGNSNGDWTDSQRAAVANYVRTSVAQKAERHYKDMQLQNEVKAMEERVDDMTNNQSGDVIEANFKIDGQMQTGTIVGGRVSVVENDVIDNEGNPKQAFIYNPNLSSVTLIVRVENPDGTVTKKQVSARDIESINSVAEAEQYKGERRSELEMDMQRSVVDMYTTPTASAIWGTDLQAGVVLPYNNMLLRLDGKDENGQWILTRVDEEGTPVKKTNPFVLSDSEFRIMGMTERLRAMQQQGAPQEDIDDAIDDINTEQDLQNIDQSDNEDNIWDNIASFMQGYTKTNQEGDFIPDESRPEAAAGYLVALQKGDIGKTIAIVNERIAELEARLASKPAEVQNNGEGVVAMAGNESMAEDAYIETQKQIMFLSNIRDGLVAKQEQQNEIEEVKFANTPVSQMEVGQQFPVEWRGQQAMATVMGKDADGRSVVTVRDMDGEDIEAGIDDMSDAQWEARRVRPQEATAPEQVPPQAAQQAPEQVETQPQEEVPQAAPQQETPQQHPLDEFIAKHGENAENKLGVTIDAINKEIASLAKDLEKAEKDLANMPEPYDEKTQKAQDKQEEKIAKLRAELDEKRNILAPYAAMQEELDRRKEVRQSRENGVTDALVKFTERLNNMLHPKRESKQDMEPQTIEEFIASRLRRKGLARTAVKTINKKTKKMVNGWKYTNPVESFDYDSFKQETGLSDSEMKNFNDPIQPFFTKEGGITFGEFVHSIWEDRGEPGVREDISDSEVRDAVIEFFRSGVSSLKDINDYIEKQRRDEQAEQDAIANDMIAQHNGYESGEAMENDLIAQASARADELLGSDTLSDEDVAAFDTELSQRLDNLVPSVEETAEETEPATQETTVESTEDEDFIQPTDEEAPFSVTGKSNEQIASEYQKRLDEAETESDRAKVIQEYLDTIGTEPAVVMTDATYEAILIENGIPIADILEIRKALADCKANNLKFNAFKYNGKVYMFSEYQDTIEDARTNYVHERQHIFTGGTKKGLSLLNKIKGLASEKEFERYVELLSGSDFYTRQYAGRPNAHKIYADEFISMAMERAYNGMDLDAELGKLGIKQDLINEIKQLDNEQRTDESLAKARRTSPVNESRQGDNGQNGGNQKRESRKVGGQRSVTVQRGEQTAERRESVKSGEIGNEQRKSDGLSEARRGEGRNLHVDNNAERGSGHDGKNQGRRPGEVEEQGLRPSYRGNEKTGSGEVSGILPIDKQTPKNTTIDEVLYSIKVNHNSPYLLKKADGSFVDPETGKRLGFDHRFMSNGEGAQAHGWGSYFSVNDLRSYAGQVKNDIYYQGKLYDVNEVNNHISEVGQMALNWFLYGVEPDKYTNDKDGMLSIIDKAINSYEVLWSGEKDDYYNRQIERFKDMRKFVEDHGDEIRIEPQRHHYNVEIPDNNGTNYFEESEPLKPEQIAMLQKQSDKENAKVEIGGFLFYANPNKNPNAEKYTFRNFLSDITSPQGGITQKQASEFFSRAGFVGTHYDGKRDGECYVIFDENDAKIVDHVRFSVTSPEETEDDLRFSTNGTHVINNGKSLVGIHNIGAEKLRKAMKNGGFANPSAAVIDIDKQEHKGYGEVSLIMPSSLVDSRTGRNAGTYAGDAYTPEYPSVSYREGKNTDKLVKDLVKGLPKELGWAIQQGIGEYMDGNRSRSGLEYLFLKERGQEMPIVKNERRYPNISTEQIDKRLGVEESANRGHSGELYAAYEKLEGDDLVDFNMWFEAYGDDEKIKQRKDLMERNAKVKEMLTEQFGEHMGYGKFDTTWYNVFRDERDAGNENIPRTLEDAAMKIDELGLRNEFEDWKQKTIDGLGYEEVIFDGYTPSGYRRYVPNTVENASRIMNKKEKTNWLSDAGTHATKAMLLDKFNTLNDIRKNRGLLESDQEVINQAYEDASDAWSELGSELANMQKIDDNRFINHDIALNRLQEAMMKRDPVAYLNKEYKYNLDEEFNDRINAVKQQIKSLPSKYFETKFRRPVYLNEFAAAVVPNDLPQDLKDRLQQSGLPLFEYDPNKEGDRRAVTLEATSGDGIRFSVANRNQAIFVSNAARAVEGIKQEKATPEQWLKMIEKNGGLKAGEDKWLGLSQWLKDQANTDAPRSDESLTEWAERNRKKTLTKQEVLDFINENAIKIEETHYAEKSDTLPEEAQAKLDSFNDEFKELISEGEDETGSLYVSDWVDYAFVAMEERYGDDFRFAFDIEGNGEDSYLMPSVDFDGEITDAAKYYLGYEGLEENPIGSVRLQYTTEGLDNKREIALTVPTIEPWNENDEIHFGDAGEGRAVAWIRFGETTTERELTDEERSEIMPPADQWEKVDGSNFVNKHDIYYYPGTRNQSYNSYIVDIGDGMFEIQGPIVRRIGSSRYPSLENAVNAFNRQYAKDRGLKKEKVLVIDEIQSKRHQEGREHGYKIEVEQAQKEWNDFLKRMHEKYEFGETDKFEDVFDKNEMAEVRRLQDQLNQAYFNHGAIPQAPFEKNWMELAMKRMLRLAAEEGYDKVAWTTGEQQAERYNLGKQVKDITASVAHDPMTGEVIEGEYEVFPHDHNDDVILQGEAAGRMDEAKVLAVYGKDLGSRIIEAAKENPEGTTLEGGDLMIGGEGMKGFYDKMIPSFMNKYGKQWGVKVGEVTMPNLEEGYQTMHSIDVNEQMKADVMEGQVMFSVKNSQKDADDNQLSLFLQNNTGEYETQDGQTIGFTSLLGAATEADAVRGRDNVQRGDDILSYQLRRLEPGETCHVERRYQKSKMFDFTGSEKIESADDVAYIFNKLEDAAVENSFIVLVKDGKPTIIHTGVGSYGSTYVNLASALVAYKNIDPDEVWFVHNHPSGSITSSQPDRDSSKKFEKVFGKKYKGGIIIDTTSGKYGVFDSKSDTESGSTRNTPSNETDIDVYEFSKQVFEKDWNPETSFRAKTNKDIAAFVSSHRLGEHDKMSLLVLNNNGNIVGNVFLPYTSIGEADIKKLADDALYYMNQMAGTNVVVYGSFTADDERAIKTLAKNIDNADGRLIDVISTNSEYTGLRSARLMGAIKEEAQEIKEDEARFSVTAQQDKDYMDAVNRGDMETAQRMVNEAAKAAMPNTKVVDENGNPLVVYRGTRAESPVRETGRFRSDLIFTSSKRVGAKHYGEPLALFINSTNPAILDYKGQEYDARVEDEFYEEGLGFTSLNRKARNAFSKGYDGLIVKNVKDGTDYTIDEYIVKNGSQIKSADPVTYDDQGNVIPLSERFNPGNDDIRFSVNGQQRIAVADEFNRRTGANMDNVSDYVRVKESLIRDWFDGLHPLEQAQKLIEEKLGRKLRDSEKAYELATQTTSVSAAMIDEEEKKHIIPILNKATELISKMMNNDRLSREEAYRRLSNYMLAKHGLERNKWFHEQALLSDPNAEEEDKSGLTGLAALLGENPDEYKAVAERIVKEFEDEYDSQEIDDYWNEMRGLTNRLLEISYESGMIDKDTYDNLKKRHKFYVPLRGFGEGTIGDIFDYIGQMPHFQETLKKAKGRKSVAGDPLANLYNMLQSAIVIGNQNKVMQKLYNLAVNSNNDLLRLKKTWYVYDDVEDRWEERYPDIPKDATEAEIDAIVKKFDADMQAAKANGKAKTKLNKLDLAKKVLPYQAKQHEMVAYIDGKKVILQVVGNPVLAQALNKANQQQLGIFAETMQGITRFMSMINTSLSPAFMLTNSARDIGFALFSAMVTGGFKKTGQMAAWMATSGWVIPRLMVTGKLDAGLVKALGKQNAAQIEQWWNEFTQNGGETGFTRTLSAEKARGQVDDMIRHMLNGSKDGESRLRKSTVGLVESAGRWSEDISRFAAYCWSRAQGNSVMESVNEAKNVTVNFNVKGGGRLAAACRAVYSFFNAALQGIGRMARLAKENPKAYAACLTACMLQGAVLPWLNMVMFGLLGGDDDDWEKYKMLTEYTANKNMVLYVGDLNPFKKTPGKFIKIPYSQELAPFAAMGNIFFRQQMGWNKGESVASQVGKMFLDLSPVSIGESKTFKGKLAKTVTPTAAKWFTELLLNEDFTGSPIQKENAWNKYARGWEKAYEGKTSKWLVDASKWLDDKTGIDISPAVAEHMFTSVLGGIGRSGDKLLRFFSNGFQLQDAPFLRTLMFDSKQQGYVGAVQREYGRLSYDVLPKVKHDVDDMTATELASFTQTEEYEIANTVSKYKTGKDLSGKETSYQGIDKMEKEYKKIAGKSDGSEEYREQLEQLRLQITDRKMEMLDEIQQIKYEHSDEVTLDNLFGLRKRIMDRVKEVEESSKEKAK